MRDEIFFAEACWGSIAAGTPFSFPFPAWDDRDPLPSVINSGCCSVTITAVHGVLLVQT